MHQQITNDMSEFSFDGIVATAPAAIAPTATATAAPLAPVSLRAATEKDRSIDGKLTSQFASFPCVLHVTRDRDSAVQKVHRCIQREEEEEGTRRRGRR